jgi:N-methylhydantoinase A
VGIRVGIDTGGTFTHLVAVDEQGGDWYVAKVPSTPARPVDALAAVLEEAHFDPADVAFIVVGTTIGINAVLTRTGARVIYLTTKGFEDVPHIQRINRKYHYDFAWRKPEPLARRRDCIGIGERTEIEWFVGPHTINGQGTFDFLHRHLNWPQPQAEQSEPASGAD